MENNSITTLEKISTSKEVLFIKSELLSTRSRGGGTAEHIHSWQLWWQCSQSNLLSLCSLLLFLISMESDWLPQFRYCLLNALGQVVDFFFKWCLLRKKVSIWWQSWILIATLVSKLWWSLICSELQKMHVYIYLDDKAVEQLVVWVCKYENV